MPAPKDPEKYKEWKEKIGKTKKINYKIPHNKLGIPKDKLYDLYVNKRYGAPTISKILNFPTRVITRRIKEYGWTRTFSEARKGKIPWNKGLKLKSLSEEHKKKISIALKGKKKTEEHKRNISKGHTGISFPSKKKGKSYEEQFGKEIAEEIKKKISENTKIAMQIITKTEWWKENFKKAINSLGYKEKRSIKAKEVMARNGMRELIAKKTKEAMQNPEIRQKLINARLGKTWEQIYGKGKTKEKKEYYRKMFLGNKLRIGLPSPRRINLKQYREEIIRRYNEGDSSVSIAQSFNVTDPVIIHRLREWGIHIRKGLCGSIKIKAKDGHIVRSYPEKIIDNFLFDNGIKHEYNKLILKSRKYRCDFYIPDIDMYIEYWGLIGYEEYDKRKVEKSKVYKDIFPKSKLKEINPGTDKDIIEPLKPLIPLCAKIQKTLSNYKKK